MIQVVVLILLFFTTFPPFCIHGWCGYVPSIRSNWKSFLLLQRASPQVGQSIDVIGAVKCSCGSALHTLHILKWGACPPVTALTLGLFRFDLDCYSWCWLRLSWCWAEEWARHLTLSTFFWLSHTDSNQISRSCIVGIFGNNQITCLPSNDLPTIPLIW
jgi:hypothetical protein